MKTTIGIIFACAMMLTLASCDYRQANTTKPGQETNDSSSKKNGVIKSLKKGANEANKYWDKQK
jgi:hypothetical protein